MKKIIAIMLAIFGVLFCLLLLQRTNNRIYYSFYSNFNEESPKLDLLGFYNVEKWGRWTKGNEAFIKFNVYALSDIEINIEPMYYLNHKHPVLNFSVYVNNKLYKKESVTRNNTLNLIVKSEDIDSTGMINLKFLIENPGNPMKLLNMEDNRNLGIGIKSLEIKPLLSLKQKIWLFFQYYNVPLLCLVFIFVYYTARKLVEKLAGISLVDFVNIIFLTLIAGSLFIPMMSISQKDRSAVENRMLAKFPQFYKNDTINRNIGKEIEKWFNDRFNGRETIITYYEKLRYALSNIYEHKGLYYNKNNQWGFSKDFLRLRHMREDERLAFIQNIKELKKFTDEHNIDLYINIVPVATCIYPETRYPFTTDCSDINIIRQDMAANGLADLLILPYEELRGHRDLVMHKLEEHWSEYRAFIGYQAVMNKIKDKYPNLKILTEDDFIITHSNQTRTNSENKLTKGSIYHILKLPESVLTYKYKNYTSKRGIVKILQNMDRTAVSQTFEQNPLKVYLIGNSYVENLFYFMRYSFNKIIKKRKNTPEFDSWDFSRWKEDIVKNKPDILIVSTIIEQGNPINGMFKEDQ